MTVIRRADGRLSQATEIAGGALRIPAALTRTGVFKYVLPDGSVRREYRSDAEVMRPDSLASLRSAPVTDMHPREQVVRLDNRKRLEVGHVADNVRADESDPRLVAADVVVTDGDVIGKVRADKRAEISCGYRCDLDDTPGTSPEGEAFDVSQINIKYNHVALLPRGHGRAGGSVALRLDSSGNEQIPAELGKGKDRETMKKITIDGIDYDPASPEFAQAFAKYSARCDAALEDLSKVEAARDTATERADTADAKIRTLEGELAEANAPERLDSLVAERDAVKTAARKVVGDEIKLDGLTPVEIRKAVVAAKVPEGFKLDDKTESYIEARFDGFVEAAGDVEPVKGPSKVAQARPPAPVVREDANQPPTHRVPDWQRPCSVHQEG